ncbi:Cold-responsive protein kinase 1 [Vitis vinifera]|uniref:Cold-responsive protein kinase 1 n=1 Tax=Vitis vinifera TaxID=29760 RepID=A0A438E9T3_VITVI|nr:Cold-responsive protein kinase 1 [Vitis vinifera]
MGLNCFGAFEWCKGKKSLREPEAEEIATNNVRLFSYNSLRSATNNFHPSSRVGGGGFGVVYRGVLRDGTQVAIKCLSAESKQGTQEFLTEINMISNIRHPNLVELIGCCIEGSNRILVYEYLENNSIASIILGSKGKHVILDWPTRVSICMGTASGLAYLHEEAEPHIVHRDIKASNVLLDEAFFLKLEILVWQNFSRTMSLMGYLAPEYALLGQLTKKADVYSFGVLMLEIISGRSSSKAAFGEELLVLVEWTWKLKEEERLLEIVDPELTDYPEDEMMRFIKVALFCTQAASHQRPNMKLVVDMLSKDVILNEKVLTRPGVYKGRPTHHVESSPQESSSSQGNKGKQSINPSVSSTSLGSQSVTQMLPR